MSDDDRLVRQFDWDVTAPSVAVAETLSEATERDASELDPLTTAIDPDALDDLVDRIGSPVHVEFEHAGHAVVVRSDGRVTVTPV